MCGIIFSHTRKKPTIEQIDLANSSVGKRGPDNVEIIQHNTVGGHWVTMVHSLLDISGHAIHQPFSEPEKPDYFLIFNGEIYNYLQLKKELQSFGYKFKSQSDTEIIIHGYKHWGADLFSKLVGMFAIAIWDSVSKKMTIDLLKSPKKKSSSNSRRSSSSKGGTRKQRL